MDLGPGRSRETIKIFKLEILCLRTTRANNNVKMEGSAFVGIDTPGKVKGYFDQIEYLEMQFGLSPC